MPEPTSTALAVSAAGASSVAVIATAMGVPAPVVLAAVLGSTVAVSAAGKLDWNWRSLMAALLSFAVALGLGIWGGAFFGNIAIGALNGAFSKLALSPGSADPFFTLLVAMFGQSQLLPIGLSILRKKAEGVAP